MNILRRFYCRIYQTIFRIAIPFLPYRSPEIVDLKDLDSVLAENKITSLCVITDGNLRGMAEKIVSGLTTSCHIYDKTMPNPTIAQVEDREDATAFLPSAAEASWTWPRSSARGSSVRRKPSKRWPACCGSERRYRP